MARIKPAGKVLIMLGIAGLLVSVFHFRDKIIPKGKQSEDVTGLMAGSGDSSPDAASTATSPNHKCLEIGVVTWGGYVGGQFWNQGFKDNANSRYRKDGICVNFHVMDDFAASRAAFRNGSMDLMWSTIDSFPTESGGFGEKVKWLFQADWSQGGDAIVVKKGINSVTDLSGKRIAVAEGTPSHTLLLWMLDSSGLSMMDVTIVKQNSAVDAATAFKTGNVDAAVVWSPDDDICVQAVSGSKVLISTKKATHIISDGFFVKEKTFQSRKADLTKLVCGWLNGADEINTTPSAKTQAAKILQENLTGVDPEFAVRSIGNVRLTTYGDNLQFFGLDSSYTGVTSKQLYEKMTTVYGKLNLAQNPLSYDQVVDPNFIKGLSGCIKGGKAESKVAFTAPTTDVVKSVAITSKPVRVSFATNSTVLDDNAKSVIEMLFVEQAKAFPTQHIRIIGNTDNTGSATVNTRISKDRAKSVVDYLVSLGFEQNRFVWDGVGPANPLCNDDTDMCRAKNRRTDFQILDK